MTNKEISYDYIRGLVEKSGNFTFLFNKGSQRKIPCFSLKVKIEDVVLLEDIRDKLGIKNKVHIYDSTKSIHSSKYAILLVRDFGNIKNVIIPLFAGKLVIKKNFFEKWINTMDNDSLVPKSYKFISKLYKSGFYDINHSFD